MGFRGGWGSNYSSNLFYVTCTASHPSMRILILWLSYIFWTPDPLRILTFWLYLNSWPPADFQNIVDICIFWFLDDSLEIISPHWPFDHHSNLYFFSPLDPRAFFPPPLNLPCAVCIHFQPPSPFSISL